MFAMANDPAAAKEKRTEPRKRQNAQGDEEGSPHRPEEFLQGDPKPVGVGNDVPDPGVKRRGIRVRPNIP